MNMQSRKQSAPVHVGDDLVARLVEYGVRRVFGCPGGQTLPLYNGIAKRKDIQHVLMRDERGAGFAADAYARMTGSIGCCDATVGPGATNFVSALAEAHSSSVPMLAIVSDIRRDWEHNRRFGAASQALDQRSVLESLTKWYGRVEMAGNLANVLQACLRIGTAGRPGPVALEIPDDVFAGPAADTAVAVNPSLSRYPRLRPAADPAVIEQTVGVLARSRKPIIIAGGGVLHAQALSEVARLAEALDAVVAMTVGAKGTIADDHPRAVGIAGRFGVPMANEALQSADAVIFIGCKVGQNTTLNWTLPRAGTPVIEIDIDAEELGRNFDSIAIHADAKLGAAALAAALPAGRARSQWDWAAIAKAQKSWWAGPIDYREAPVIGVVKPQDVLRILSERLGNEDALVCDASLSSGWGATRWRTTAAGRRFFAPRGLAGLGWGLPAAIGVAYARKDMGAPGRVYCLAGDGGWAYSMAEVETAVRERLPIIALVLNNSTLGWIRHTAHTRYPGEMVSQNFMDVRFGAAAAALGARSYYVTSLDELGSALADAQRSEEPCVIEIRSCPHETPVVAAPRSGAGGY
jgi:acetolactate synthase-1/2/3 large subunit